MTTPRSTLSVRLDPELAEALDQYCATRGETRTQVVQEGLAEYLVSRVGPTLSSLAEAVLPPDGESGKHRSAGKSRQRRYRDYVREKRRR